VECKSLGNFFELSSSGAAGVPSGLDLETAVRGVSGRLKDPARASPLLLASIQSYDGL